MNPGPHIAPSPPGVPGSIRYLKRQEIDTARWDACVEDAPNGLIYGRSFYLDAMTAGQWDALVLEDYQAVMPLTWRRKAGIRYLCQPAFTQQTGIFSRATASPSQTSPVATIPSPGAAPVEPAAPAPANPSPGVPSPLVEAFLRQAIRHFRFAEIFLNYGNEHPYLEKHTNFILPLTSSYESLSANYKKDLVRNLKEAARSTLRYIKDFDLRTALQDFRRQYAAGLPNIREEDYRHFEQLCLFLQQQGQLLVRAVTDGQQQRLCTAVLLRDAARFYLLNSTTLPAGRPTEANHFLLDQFIKEWAGTSMILDFEGSDHPGIAHFYRNFGSADQPYFFYRHNRLPWPLKLVKR
jgi:hypothetical protein